MILVIFRLLGSYAEMRSFGVSYADNIILNKNVFPRASITKNALLKTSRTISFFLQDLIPAVALVITPKSSTKPRIRIFLPINVYKLVILF